MPSRRARGSSQPDPLYAVGQEDNPRAASVLVQFASLVSKLTVATLSTPCGRLRENLANAASQATDGGDHPAQKTKATTRPLCAVSENLSPCTVENDTSVSFPSRSTRFKSSLILWRVPSSRANCAA